MINRSPSTISRELRRNRNACGGYSARVAQQQMQARRQVYRPMRKLLPDSERFELVAHMLRERLSPEQIAGKLRSMNIPSLREAYVCRETIYNAIYALPVGELRKELIICLRQSKTSEAQLAIVFANPLFDDITDDIDDYILENVVKKLLKDPAQLDDIRSTIKKANSIYETYEEWADYLSVVEKIIGLDLEDTIAEDLIDKGKNLAEKVAERAGACTEDD